MATTETIDLSGCECCSGCTTDQDCCPGKAVPCTLYVTVEGCLSFSFTLEWDGEHGWYGHGGDLDGLNIFGQLSCSGGRWFGLPWTGACGDGHSYELYPCGPPPCTDPGPDIQCDPFQLQWTAGWVNTGPTPGGCCDHVGGIVVTITE